VERKEFCDGGFNLCFLHPLFVEHFIQEFQNQIEILLKQTYPEEFVPSAVEESEEMQTS